MPRLRTIVVSLLAVLAVGSIAATTASAAIQGPWWQKKEGAKQVKIEPNTHLQIKSKNEAGTVFLLKSKAVGFAVVIECRRVENKGFIWNGPHTGRDEAVVTWNECFVAASSAVCRGFPVTVETTHVRTELMWKYQGNSSELNEAGGQQKIYDVFAPEVEKSEEYEPEPGVHAFRAKFTSITIPAEFEGIKCAVANTYPVYAEGTRYLNWEDQKPASHEVIWGTAAQVEPQNADAKSGTLKWVFPNVKKLHVEGAEQVAKLQFGAEPAELQGTIKVEAEDGITEFGAWNKV
jgi:hypothetical protein